MDARRAVVLNRLLCRYRNRVSVGFGSGVSGIIRVTNGSINTSKNDCHSVTRSVQVLNNHLFPQNPSFDYSYPGRRYYAGRR